MAIKRTSHAVYDTSYHLVWCPKYRKKIIGREDIRKRAEQFIRPISEEYGFEILEWKVNSDHLHTLVSFAPRHSIGEVVRIIKSISARELFREFGSFKRQLWSGQLWKDGYFARTVGDRMTRDIVAKYIKEHQKLEQGPAQLELKLR